MFVVGATWHWSDLTFIEPSVVKLDYGKVSASDISRFNITLWYEELHASEIVLSGSTWSLNTVKRFMTWTNALR